MSSTRFSLNLLHFWSDNAFAPHLPPASFPFTQSFPDLNLHLTSRFEFFFDFCSIQYMFLSLTMWRSAWWAQWSSDLAPDSTFWLAESKHQGLSQQPVISLMVYVPSCSEWFQEDRAKPLCSLREHVTWGSNKSLRGLGVQSGKSQLSIGEVPFWTTVRSRSFVSILRTFYLESKEVIEEKQLFPREKINACVQT